MRTYKYTSCLLFFIASLVSSNPCRADNINYILTSEQAALLKKMDRISDMVANVNTTAFKAEHDIFTEFKKSTSQKENLSFSNIGKSVRDNSQGGMTTTGRQLDVAINGVGYFMVNTKFGPMYTRNGSFMVSREGILVSHDGDPIAGPGGGQVEFTEQDIEISIKEDGLVKAGQEERGQIGVFTFDNENLLQRVGKGLYKTNQTAKIAENYLIAQGMLENSNVNSVTAMTDLVAVSRTIENVTKIADTHNDAQLNMIRKMSE